MPKNANQKGLVAQYYAFGISWLIYSLLFPMHSVGGLVLNGIVSGLVAFGVWLLAKSKAPKKDAKTVQEPRQPVQDEKPLSDDEKQLAECELYLSAVHKYVLQSQQKHLPIEDELKEVENNLDKVVEELKQHPEDLPKMHKFLNFYMPTMLKLLKTYLEVADLKGDNFDQINLETEGMLHTMSIALNKQLDKLYADDAMDLKADVSVLQQMLYQEGLTEDGQNSGKKTGRSAGLS